MPYQIEEKDNEISEIFLHISNCGFNHLLDKNIKGSFYKHWLIMPYKIKKFPLQASGIAQSGRPIKYFMMYIKSICRCWLISIKCLMYFECYIYGHLGHIFSFNLQL
jgi:hypothetical protein